MKKLSCALPLFFLFLTISSATTYRVNNRTDIAIDYTPAHLFDNIPDAITAASSGDTILIEGSPNSYSTSFVIVDKRLAIFGPGGFLSENDTDPSIPRTCFS